METKTSATKEKPVLTWENVLTAPEKRRLRQGLPLLPRPDQKELLKWTGTFSDEEMMTNAEIESMGLTHE